MPKKSPARHSSAQQRPQPKRKDVLLVRATSSTEVVEVDEEEETDAQETTETTKAGATKAKPSGAVVKTGARPASGALKPTTIAKPKPGAQPTRALQGAKRGGRPGQRVGRPGPRIQVGRQANLVTAEHYRYVLKDLRMTGVLAFLMFAALIALTFILPHVLNY